MKESGACPEKIVVVGGGTSGWMAAHLIHARWKNAEIVLLEPKDIGTVGVGEGSTPHLKVFFDTIGISESEWMPRCNATYKNGINFSGWSARPGFSTYFHPFPAQVDDLTTPLLFRMAKNRLLGRNVNAHPDHFFLGSYLTRENLGPIAAECFPFTVAYGYHFDSALLGNFLAERASKKNIRVLDAAVIEVMCSDSGEINALRLDDNSTLRGDFFIDCTGFRSLLLQSALRVPFNSYKDTLFNDSAVVIAGERPEVLPPATQSTALLNGWAWQIPLSNRIGNGYVYSSRYIDSDQAELELRSHLGLLESNVTAKHLSMKIGCVKKHWTRNCLGVGLSQGFIEPLEATALALTYETVVHFMHCFERGVFSNKYEAEFNDTMNAKFAGVRDYIVCHYKASQRLDTQYWRDNASNGRVSERVKTILQLWSEGDNFEQTLSGQQLSGVFPAKSWACMLAGYGYFPAGIASSCSASSQAELDQVADFIRRCGLNFTPHNELLGQLAH
ncbi:tryptophan 7-halogenase [Gilvimarinus sp. SDUM040013]|uniref:Tryptophan halogenase family protein n=1 Tax=Gilvimarinus gilvus TaxID=3058038 RepID=A0ABU4RSE6_9GAMM|nr:tryptophan halogenase family protein [Gilvimarinus sp. SDUM040013]MDO3388262.1 tryptophan 7-halogenase [Gilvimarinus sp. SDUM040013]MDX6847812.1 tryptophan halogenase family protein [Gilvimarinus sp. SDUM040013]